MTNKTPTTLGAALCAAMLIAPIYVHAGGLDEGLSDPVVRPQYVFPPTTQPYSAPTMEQRSAARPAMVANDQFGNPYTTSDAEGVAGNAAGPIILARSGDLTYATLLYGFDNTDVLGTPIFATIHDYLPNGTRGPLDGARIRGEVQYSRDDAAIIFNQAILPNGLEVPIQAIAVSDRDGRTGVAGNVNRHTLSRYGSLFLAGIIQGYGEVAQARLRAQYDNGGDTIIVGDGSTVTVEDSGAPSDGEILAGSIAPIGNNLAGIAAQNFNRPFTITAPTGMGFSLVFLQTLVTQPSDVTGRAYNPRTGEYEAVRLTNSIPASGEWGSVPPTGGDQQVFVPQAVQDAVTATGGSN